MIWLICERCGAWGLDLETLSVRTQNRTATATRDCRLSRLPVIGLWGHDLRTLGTLLNLGHYAGIRCLRGLVSFRIKSQC